jgi:hypothetical protein
MTLKHLFRYYYTLHNIKNNQFIYFATNKYQKLPLFTVVCSKCRVSNTVTMHYQLHVILSSYTDLICFQLATTKLNAETKSSKGDLIQLKLELIIIQFSTNDHHLFKKSPAIEIYGSETIIPV